MRHGELHIQIGSKSTFDNGDELKTRILRCSVTFGKYSLTFILLAQRDEELFQVSYRFSIPQADLLG
jgi:hypothetical protein